MRAWAATQLAVAREVRLEADRMRYGGPDARPKIWVIEGDKECEIDLPDDEDVITFSRPALLEWAARLLAEQPL
jgi:hypothetical protein